ncbi:MAG: hypothetical protein LQ339_002492 [Xanthoria mediterranea]|nr:MAG: hypothetical protein LQ339_002492 [Xanthoria mediterranea]
MSSASAPMAGCSLDRLAPELQHMIFAEVDTSDIPTLRLTCRSLAAVGLEYILPEVELLFTPKSLERLRGISEHPTLSCHVKSLVYRADSLRTCSNIEEWYEQIPQAAYIRFCDSHSCGPKPPEWEFWHEWAAWLGINRLSRLDPSTKTLFHDAWVKYQALWNQQHELRRSGFGQATIMTALSKLPRLQNIILSNHIDMADPMKDRDYHGQSLNLKAHADVLAASIGDQGYSHCSGNPHLLSLLRGIVHGKVAVKNLSFGWVEWHFFEIPGIIDLVRRALRSLTALKMRLIGYIDLPDYPSTVSDLVLAFFQSLPNLETLDVIFDAPGDFEQRVDLTAVFGNIVWPHLRILSLEDLKTSQSSLIDFLERHARTLKVLRIGFIELREGTWPQIWASVRNLVDLVDFEIREDICLKSEADTAVENCECWGNTEKIRNYVLRAAGTDNYTVQDLCRYHVQESVG